MTRSTVHDDFACPHCGAALRGGATFCRACGASEDSGWDENATDGYGAEDDFDYDDYLAREFPQHAPPERRMTGRQGLVLLVAFLLVLALLLGSLAR